MKSRTRIVAMALAFCMILGAFEPAAKSFAQQVPAEASEAKSETETTKENIPEEPTEPEVSKDSTPEESVKPEVGKETIPGEALQESAEAVLMEKSSKENPMPAVVAEAMQALEASAGEPVLHQVTFVFNKEVSGAVVPTAISVESGNEITLPSVNLDALGDQSFLYWDMQGQKMDPGAKITVDEDCTITGVWEGAYGKVSVSFITGELTYKDWKYGFEEVDSLDGYEATLTKGDASYEPERKEDGTYYYTKLTKGAYNFTVKVPENMEIIGIYDANEFASTKQPVEFEGNVITLPFLSYNLSLGKSLYVLVKEKPNNPDNTNTENTETPHPENPDNAQSKDPEIVNPEQPNNPQSNESKSEKVVEKTGTKTVVETKRSSEKTAAKTGDAFSVTAALLLMTLSGIGFYATRRKKELID